MTRVTFPGPKPLWKTLVPAPMEAICSGVSGSILGLAGSFFRAACSLRRAATRSRAACAYDAASFDAVVRLLPGARLLFFVFVVAAAIGFGCAWMCGFSRSAVGFRRRSPRIRRLFAVRLACCLLELGCAHCLYAVGHLRFRWCAGRWCSFLLSLRRRDFLRVRRGFNSESRSLSSS